MSCVNRNTEGRIIEVLDNSNQPSKLYSDTLQITNNEETALDIWAVGNSEEFQQVNGLTSNEPGIEEVTVFMNRSNNQNKRLSKQNIDSLRNNLLSLPVNSIQELYQQVNQLYPNGIFTVTSQTLNRTELYSELEIERILMDESLQNNVKVITDRIIAQASLNNQNTENINAQMPLYETPELITVMNTENVIGVGKFEQVNPFLIDAQLREKVGGIKDRDQFEQQLFSSGVDEAITEQYQNNAEYANKLFNAYSSMERMQVLEEDENGELVSPNPAHNLLKQGLITGKSATELLDTIDLLLSTPRIVFTNSGVEVEDMLLRAEDFATDLGIDIIGISTQDYTYDEIIPMLETLGMLVDNAQNSTVTDSDIEDFLFTRDIVFKQTDAQVFTARLMNANNRGRNLVVVDSNLSEQQLFDQNSLIKADDEGVYHRIARQQDLEGLYDYVTDLVQFNPNIIEKTALYPTAYNSNGTFSYQKAINPGNREGIREDLVRYAQQQPFSEELALYKIAFGHPITFPMKEKNVTSEIESMQSATQDFEYLTGEFISDFAQIYLQEKLKASDLFNKVLNHFTFNNRGIVLKDVDPYSKQEIALLTPGTGTLSYLKQYAAISKDENINTIFPAEQSQQIKQNSYRDFYVNNPEQLAQKTIQYELNENWDVLATQNSQDNYLNVNGDIWEKMKDYKNITLYQKLPSPSNPNFNQPNISANINTDYNPEEFIELIETLENMSKSEKLYNRKELERINNEKQC